MRLWSLHPCYLDAKGLVALWREGLLALHFLSGKTKGYKNHPQLIRFRNTRNPLGAITSYLKSVADEATQRGYNFDKSKLPNRAIRSKLRVTTGQVDYEFQHLLNKLSVRDYKRYQQIALLKKPELHPLFYLDNGEIESWEILPK